mgnify:CR=1 FL=1
MKKGIISAGHEETAKAAAIILEEGGNAFDAALGAMLAACVAEPVLASLGGGGFLLARPAETDPQLYDFFVQTPGAKLPRDDTDFYPIIADFGTAQQEFHIGLGAMACPGMVRGLFGVHADLGTMPLARIAEPARKLAKDGLRINRQQAYILSVVEKIFSSNANCLAAYGSTIKPSSVLREGENFTNTDFSDFLDALTREGEDLFYRGEIAARIDQDCRTGGGHLRRQDLEDYAMVRRAPLQVALGDRLLLSNPPPSCGGILIAFALSALEDAALETCEFGSKGHLEILAKVMDLTNEARVAARLHERGDHDPRESLLDPKLLDIYKKRIAGHAAAHRGTTHINVADSKGNAASLSVSNGEGTAYIVPGTGIMINNMLGEEDVVPTGFHNWPPDTRMSSMMAPSALVDPDGAVTVMGSGGSNRIRTAILQVLLNLTSFAMPLERAVSSPRIHQEGGVLSLEPGFREESVAALCDLYPDHKMWSDRNMFFGGVHTVRYDPKGRTSDAAGDPRRGGVSIVL